jgi:hypothetical protein
MAKFNEILAGRFNRFLQKYLSMKGGPPAAQLATEITPGFEVEQLPVELRVLMSFDRYYGGASVAGVAAQDNAIQYVNPSGSNALMVIENLLIVVQANATITISTAFNSPAPLTNIFAPTRIDARSNARNPLVISSGNNVNADLGFGQGSYSLTQQMQLIAASENQEIVLAPGSGFRIRNVTVNVQLAVWMVFRSRPMEESELLVT